VTKGYILELTDLFSSFELDDFYPEAISAYGEYPPLSKQYWGVPFQGMLHLIAESFNFSSLRSSPLNFSDAITVVQEM
jgi:hypothetical protein